MPPTSERIIDGLDLYSNNPAALLLSREPGFSRAYEHRWLALARCPCQHEGRSGGRVRMKRDVATGGFWRVDQSSKPVGGEGSGDRRCVNAFFASAAGGKRTESSMKTAWLMEELTLGGGGRSAESTIPVFCELYVREQASKEEKLRILGEKRVPFDSCGKPKPVRVLLPEDLFDKVCQVIGGGQGQAPPPWTAPRLHSDHHADYDGVATLPVLPMHDRVGALNTPPWPLVGPDHHPHHVAAPPPQQQHHQLADFWLPSTSGQGDEAVHVKKKQRLGGADCKSIVHDEEWGDQAADGCGFTEKEPVPTPSAAGLEDGTADTFEPSAAGLYETVDRGGDLELMDWSDIEFLFD